MDRFEGSSVGPVKLLQTRLASYAEILRDGFFPSSAIGAIYPALQRGSGTFSLEADVEKALEMVTQWLPKSPNAPIPAHRRRKRNELIEFNNNMAVPPWVLDQCCGLVFLFTTKGGFVFSGEFGSGFVMSKLNIGTPEQRWSGPSAISMGGIGWGALIGVSRSFHVIVLNNERDLAAFSSTGNVTLGGNVCAALGPIGRAGVAELQAGPSFLRPSYTYSSCVGAYAGISLNGSMLVPNHRANARFYKGPVTVNDILSGDEGLYIATENTVLSNLHKALNFASVDTTPPPHFTPPDHAKETLPPPPGLVAPKAVTASRPGKAHDLHVLVPDGEIPS
eukprot:jgi/Mesvir1/12845/Mv05877-RA.1